MERQEEGLRFRLHGTLLGGCSLALSVLALLAEQDPGGATSLLGSTVAPPSEALTRSVDLVKTLPPSLGLVLQPEEPERWPDEAVDLDRRVDEAERRADVAAEVERRVDEVERRVDEAERRADVAADLERRADEAERRVNEVVEAAVVLVRTGPAPLPLRIWCWMAGGSCFMGLSCTQKVSRFTGLSTRAVRSRIPSLASLSWTNSSALLSWLTGSSCGLLLCS